MSDWRTANAGEDFDVVVVGSGFGGAVTTFRQAEAGRSVCLLERGKAYPPGSFPRSPTGVSRNLWDPSEGLHGLFDLWSFRRTDAIVSSGLGGGSLIYANVLLRKDERWFNRDLPGGGYESWPVTRAELDADYDRVEAMLTPTQYPEDYAAASHKTQALRSAAVRLGLEWSRPPIAVTFGSPARPGIPFDDGTNNLHGVPRLTCRRCGSCDLGCNEGSKNTLDLTYLSKADPHYAEIRTGAEVRDFGPVKGGWEVGYVEHQDRNRGHRTNTRALPVKRIRARRLVLAGGALGTTYLLLRNRAAIPRISERIGKRFSGNGDFLGFLSHSPNPLDPSSGPVITSTIRIADRIEGGEGPGFYIQDGGYPGVIDWIKEIIPPLGLGRRALTLAATRLWQAATGAAPTRVGHQAAALFGGAEQSANVLPLLVMGRDCPDSTLYLRRGFLELDTGNGSAEYFRNVRTALNSLSGALDARYHDGLSALLSRTITVHPLGGAAMAANPREGVVDSYGEVFGHPGLYVVDGAVMPGPVGANPSLTIAALAERFSRRMLEVQP